MASANPVSPPDARAGALWRTAWQRVPEAVAGRLADGGAALEIGCASGLACLALAQAIPAARVRGHDTDADAIGRAVALASAAGIGDRVSFAVDDSTRLPRAAFDLITADGLGVRSPDPGRVLNAIRNALVPEGLCLLLEPRGLRVGTPDLETLALRAGLSRIRLVSREGGVLLYELAR